MIKVEEFNQLDNIEVIEKIYDELLLHDINAIPSTDRKIKQKYFSKLCHDLIQQYLKWNDYLHSNNIMQLFKSVALCNESTKKPLWFIRYEILIYGKRTPLYFVNNPEILFDKINTICESEKEIQIERLELAIESLFNFYRNMFLKDGSNEEDRNSFIHYFKSNFVDTYDEVDKELFSEEIISIIDSFIEYVYNPSKFIEPGLSNEEFEVWEEEDEKIIEKVKEVTVSTSQNTKKEEITTQSIEIDELPKGELQNLKGKTIRFIGALNKSSIKNKLIGISKEYEFEVELYDDYEKITNMDFSKMRYSNRISGIIAGPMPHSIKGMGSYSSGLEMLKNEPGYPPVVECIAGEKLKITATSLWKALQELDAELGSK